MSSSAKQGKSKDMYRVLDKQIRVAAVNSMYKRFSGWYSKVTDHYSGKATMAQVNTTFSAQIAKIPDMDRERFDGFRDDILASAAMKRFKSFDKFLVTLFATRVESLVPGTWRRFRSRFPSGIDFVIEMYTCASEVVRENPRLFSPGNGVQAKKLLDDAVLDTIDTFMPLDEIVDAVGSQSEDEIEEVDEKTTTAVDADVVTGDDDVVEVVQEEIGSPPQKRRRVAEFDENTFSL